MQGDGGFRRFRRVSRRTASVAIWPIESVTCARIEPPGTSSNALDNDPNHSPPIRPTRQEASMLKSKERLTEKLIQSLKATRGRIERRDSDVPGFGIRVTPDGRKTFFLRYGPKGATRLT